jgi:hypothetical protein
MWVDWIMAAAVLERQAQASQLGKVSANRAAAVHQVEDSSETEYQRRKLVMKRKARRIASRTRELQRAAAEAQAAAMAQAHAARIARELLPFQLEMRRQDLQRRSELERNLILNRALNPNPQVPFVQPPPLRHPSTQGLLP